MSQVKDPSDNPFFMALNLDEEKKDAQKVLEKKPAMDGDEKQLAELMNGELLQLHSLIKESFEDDILDRVLAQIDPNLKMPKNANALVQSPSDNGETLEEVDDATRQKLMAVTEALKTHPMLLMAEVKKHVVACDESNDETPKTQHIFAESFEPTEEALNQVLSKHAATIFSLSYCPWCRVAQAFLAQSNVQAYVVEVDHLSNRRQVSDFLGTKFNFKTYPKILLGKKFIGGNSALRQIAQEHKLCEMVNQGL